MASPLCLVCPRTTTLEEELFEVCLRPKTDHAGHFQIFSNNQLLVSKKDPGFRHQGAQKKATRQNLSKKTIGIWTDSLMRIFPLEFERQITSPTVFDSFFL